MRIGIDRVACGIERSSRQQVETRRISEEFRRVAGGFAARQSFGNGWAGSIVKGG